MAMKIIAIVMKPNMDTAMIMLMGTGTRILTVSAARAPAEG